MISNYSKNVSVDTTGAMIIEFDIEEMDSFILTPNQDIYIGFGDLSQAVFPVLASSSFAMSHQDFKNQTLEKIYAMMSKYLLKININIMPAQKIVRIFAKGQLVTATISISYLGGNR
jgi:hypothetical protein